MRTITSTYTNYLIASSIILLFTSCIISNKGSGSSLYDNRADDPSLPARDDHFDKPDEGVIRILTYNIRNCTGMDGKTDFDRVADVINRINPQIVALQEVDSVTFRMNGADVLGVLAEKTNMFPSYGPAIDFQGGKYGNGVLSREKPLRSEYIPLPGRQERRSLLMVEFKDYIIYSTHLNNAFPGDRHGSVMIYRL
jgi:endonuclease/exonuclease/phosphatase family metal-dependent hydrolase